MRSPRNARLAFESELSLLPPFSCTIVQDGRPGRGRSQGRRELGGPAPWRQRRLFEQRRQRQAAAGSGRAAPPRHGGVLSTHLDDARRQHIAALHSGRFSEGQLPSSSLGKHRECCRVLRSSFPKPQEWRDRSIHSRPPLGALSPLPGWDVLRLLEGGRFPPSPHTQLWLYPLPASWAENCHLEGEETEATKEKTGKILTEFLRFYEDQYGVALFNSMRHEIEGTGLPQAQLLWRKVPLEERIIFSGNLFQYQEDNKKWRNRFSLVPHNYGLVLYENKVAYERQIPPRAVINSAGYKILTSLDQYLELVGNSLPGTTPKSGSAPILKCPTQFPLILWHPSARHYYFCMMTEAEQDKWQAVLQDCVRHCNNGIPEDSKVEGPAFTDAIRMYRQSKELYGTWEMLCGNEVQILSNLVMEELSPELKAELVPRLKGKPQERQRQWIQISDAVYRMVYEQAKARFEAVLSKLQLARPAMEAVIRTDMDQIITSKEHLASKIRASILPKAEVCVRNHVQPYIPSILEALMVPTSQGFTEVRDVFFKEVTDMNLNVINEGGIDKLGEYMEKLSQLAYHPLKMHSCYEKMEPLRLDGLQQRFDVSSMSVFKQRAQIHMREVGTGLASTLALPAILHELSRFQELIFEDFARFILVENTYEEVVLQTVMKDILQAVKEAAVQRKHNLYRDSVVMHNSDPNLHLLAEGAPIDWGEEYGDSGAGGGDPGAQEAAPLSEKRRRAKQVVSVVQDEDAGLPFEAAPEPPSPSSPDSVTELRGLLTRDLQAESPPLAGPLLNGAPVQESPQPGLAPEATSPPASPLRQLPSEKLVGLEPPKPSDQETGEQVSSPGSRPPIHTTTVHMALLSPLFSSLFLRDVRRWLVLRDPLRVPPSPTLNAKLTSSTNTFRLKMLSSGRGNLRGTGTIITPTLWSCREGSPHPLYRI
ncbi:PREDICTED: niban-like protein 1 [Bison bison bison]|uniref:Protein Niban 2 n=1 Tax=Bison bison bison TaxID=43346 RepID=A0A6P3ILU7_BISBB|nr:PREDICTED: niban-like protein 1 [Bison bison bison]